MKKYEILPIITVVLVATMLLLPQHSIFSGNSANAYSPCNCVIFRLDDVEDQGNSDKPNIALMNHFIDTNHKLSAEIVVNNFGNSGTNGNVYKTVKEGYDAGLFELGVHGFNHVRHSQLSEEQQKDDFGKARNKLISLFDDPNVRLFVPPFNDFNSDTIKAMAENKLDIFSSSYTSERTTTNIYKVSNSFETDNSIIQLSEVTVFDNDTQQYLKRRVYHVPFDISLFNMIEPTGTLSGQNLVDAVLSKTATQISNTGFAVITLHPTDIATYNSATGSWGNNVNEVKFQAVKDIITALEARGYGFSYMSDVTPAPFSNVVPGPSQSATLTLNTIANVGWGVDVTVTGKLSDSASGAGIEGATITFDGTGAENLQSVTTTSDGTFTAKGKAPSTVATGWNVHANFAGDSNHDASASLPKTYNTIAHTVTIAVAASKGSLPWGAQTSFTATMTDTTAGVPSGTLVTGKGVTLDGTGVIGLSSSTQTTDDNGKATFTGTAPANVATGLTYQAHFGGDNLYKKMDSSIRTYSTLKHAVTLGLAVLKTGDPSGTASTTVGAGENYKVQGTLNDPLTGTLKEKTITFTATDPITISDKTTNTNGFYSGSQAAPSTAGTYNIQSKFAGDDLYNSKDSETRTLTVTSNGPSQSTSLTLNGISNVGWGVDVTVTGKLSDSASGAGIEGATITFDGTGAENLQSVTTTSDGTFTAKGKAPSTVGTGWNVQAHFAGDNVNKKSDSTSRTYSTTKHATGLSIAVSDTSVAPGASYKVSGTLTDTTVQPQKQLASKTITFKADDPIKISDKTTNTNGFYSATQGAPSTAGTYNIQSQFAGDDLYNSKNSSTKTLTVQ